MSDSKLKIQLSEIHYPYVLRQKIMQARVNDLRDCNKHERYKVAIARLQVDLHKTITCVKDDKRVVN